MAPTVHGGRRGRRRSRSPPSPCRRATPADADRGCLRSRSSPAPRARSAKHGTLEFVEPFGSVAVVKGIAERDHAGGPVVRRAISAASCAPASSACHRAAGRCRAARRTSPSRNGCRRRSACARPATRPRRTQSSTRCSPFTRLSWSVIESVHLRPFKVGTHSASLIRSSSASCRMSSCASPATISLLISSSAGTASGDTRSSRRVHDPAHGCASISASRAMSSRPVAASS